jgi:hypothetical protein
VSVAGNRTIPEASEIPISHSVASESLHHLQFSPFASITPSPGKEPKARTQNRDKQQNVFLNSAEKKKNSSRKRTIKV